MRISIAQLNFHIANFEYNTKVIVEAIRSARERGVDLILFSELSVCGYPPLDLLEQGDFIDRCRAAVDEIAMEAIGIAVIVGAPAINPEARGKKLFNAAWFLNGGKVETVRYKSLLPTYDIFDEYRYFEPNRSFEIVEYQGVRMALTICEDLWDDQPVENAFARNRLYTLSPMEELMKQSPQLILNLSASPFASNRLNAREQVMQYNAQRFGLPLFYSNQVGAHAELIFDGGSMVLDGKGEVADRFAPFTTGVRDYLFENGSVSPVGEPEVFHQNLGDESRVEMVRKALVFGIKDYFRKSGFSGNPGIVGWH